MMNQTNYIHPGQSHITGSMRDYFLKASYNQLDISTTVLGPYTVSHDRAYYGANTESGDDIRPRELVQEAINLAINDIDVSQFDNNNDGWIECVHILYAGQGENIAGAPSECIWPHKWSLANAINSNGFSMKRYIVTPELSTINSYRGIGTICHELGHIFGAPDFYDTKQNKDTFPGTGTWDLMGGGNWNGSYEYADDCYIRAYSPAHPNPYIKKEIFGWIETIDEVSGNDNLYTLRPAELDSNSIYRLSTSTQGEYYLLENRQGSYLKGSGLVIYHVHKNIKNGFLLNNVNVKHPQKMYVVDANNHIEKSAMGTPESYGNINLYTATFRSTNSKNMYFTSTSLPSNSDWEGNTTQNKNVCFISEEMIDGEKCVKFVLNPEISGPDILCDSAIYSLKHVPSNANIQWSYIRPSETPISTTPLLIGFGQGTKNVCFKRGNNISGVAINPPPGEPILPIVPLSNSSTIVITPYSGTITIKADVSLNNDTFTLTKNIYMPEPVLINDSLAGSQWRVGKKIQLSIKSPKDEIVNDTDIRWDIQMPGVAPYSICGKSISLTPPNIGTATITATYINGCNDEYMSQTKTYKVQYGMIPFYANPVSGGNVEISVTNGNASDVVNGVQSMAMNQSEPYMGAYRLELWHDIYGKVREMDVPENTPTVTMNVDGLNSGIYILRLIVDNQLIQTSQMIIK
jgi:M6 family metalloprotease-like protein